MKIVKDIPQLQSALRVSNQPRGFVPTMGALHAGHVSLLERSKSENTETILSVFVNPTQFNDASDYQNYPITLKSDLDIAQELGVDIVFAPSVDILYPNGIDISVTERAFALTMEGEHRPGHFDGMLTIVLKLLNLMQADHAYFGAKDYQQFRLVQDLAKAFFCQTKIIVCPTIREQSGLALSSRNQRLTPEQRKTAANLYQVISTEQCPITASKQLTCLGFSVDYVCDVAGRRYAAAYLGQVRLIDNIEL